MGHVSEEQWFRTELTGRAVWKLLVKGLQLYLPGYTVTPGEVRVSARPAPFPVPVHVDGTGFGLQVRRERPRREPDREIFVRGEGGGVIGIAIAGPVAAVGSRVVDAGSLVRYARRLTYETLYDPEEADSAGPAVRAARSLQDVVFLDPENGFGLGVELDPATRVPVARLLVGLEPRAGNGGAAEKGGSVRVQAYPAAGLPAQAVRSHS
ncbi:hypothetical protein [Actinocorallia populi]|uniref:hypothetical protein n=1 Tax=Actinocorallia populi TaxID=2079200 RepID=UPI001300179B|nr:hypothetical protein [Actinocorallia populi]